MYVELLPAASLLTNTELHRNYFIGRSALARF